MARKDIREQRAEAGNRFAQDIDADLLARGLKPRIYEQVFGGLPKTDDQIRDDREKKAKKRSEAEAEVRSVKYRAVSVMTDVCWGDMEPRQHDRDMIAHVLYRLALHYGLEKRGYHV